MKDKVNKKKNLLLLESHHTAVDVLSRAIQGKNS